MHGGPQRRAPIRSLRLVAVGAILATVLVPAVKAPAAPAQPRFEGTFSQAAAYDISRPVSEIARQSRSTAAAPATTASSDEIRPERGRTATGRGHSADAALRDATVPQSIGGTIANFEGFGQQDNFTVTGRRVNPPDPVGDVGPNHYVQMNNLVWGVFSKTGTRLAGPMSLGSLWAGFPVEQCSDNAGDPIVLYDQFADRWILSQFTSRGSNYPNEPLSLFYNCIAVSTTGDPTGSYYRYAFTTGYNFPDYPKYGVWRDSYLITTREFGIQDPSIYQIGVYGLERNKLIEGDPNARAASVVLRDGQVPLSLIGDGLLPPDADGKTKPKNDAPAPIVGTQDDDASYGATSDALNIWDFDVKWTARPTASIAFKAQLPVAAFDSIYPCGPTRGCLPQPGITNPDQFLDVLSYRQRPIWRLAYRNNGTYESLVTNQSVEATPGHAGTRWYEIRRVNGEYTVHQQGTHAPADGIHRWLGSIAQDKNGNTALGYSVVSAIDVYPGIRYTGRLAGDPLGEMTLGEGVIVNGTAAQTTPNSRWGDYSSLNVDPVDDCTFWYVNEYYTVEGAALAPAGNGWQTRIASFKLPGC
ncbi:hypothetical protein ONA70_13265 [Micromonospora yasonensis]|uniref:hypothetical protein n=1 Tax=Micromonospora yasonensis TaxID=1128667 RepID=UPI0022323952|nr:hypothetical protein [Micromonospora yasonensis]MCW3841071.1 hypothetical protein [Micromonospora yasonensis]